METSSQSPLQKLIADRIAELESNPFEAARRGGLERSYINDILIGRKKSVRTDKIEQLARALELDPRDLALAMATPAEAARSVPLMGYLGAGAEIEPEFEQVPPEGLESIDLPFDVPEDLWAFRVKGTSMLPLYREGVVIIVYREQRRPLETFFGQEAAVRTRDGRRFIKTIMRGTGRAVNLLSWNAPPIEGVHLEWIGEIFAAIPPEALRRTVRKIERQGGIQGQLRLKSA